MLPTRQGSIRLFRFAGIDVFLHWSWFAVAAFEMTGRPKNYSSPLWNVLEYMALFLIVLLHEFGHALACRQVGGRANQIVLWPLGGVAYVAPPPRPGATLWSIAAGPLVNVALLPLLTLLHFLGRSWGWPQSVPNAFALLQMVWIINAVLLGFNLLPIYPLDGGQILHSLLWFPLGRARSLMVATLVGFVGVALLVSYALWVQSIWLGIVAAFILMNCWRGWQQARGLAQAARAPRHEDFACPRCRAAPPRGSFWRCGQCRASFDTFETGGVCPRCRTEFAVTMCLECGNPSPVTHWILPVAPASLPPLPRAGENSGSVI